MTPDNPPPEGVLPPGLDRRGFLRGVAGGTAAVALASLLPAGCGRDYPQARADRADLQGLTDKEYAVARAAAEALLVDVPVDPGLVVRRLDRELALVGDPVLADMKTVLGLVEHMTPLGGRLRRFTALPLERRRAYLAGWRDSRFNLRRGAYNALRGFVAFFAFADDATRPLTGFGGPWPEHIQVPAYPVDYGGVA
ncbi:MAG: twin-arginine translocation signal domain-containing protein [Gemmatimonadota bacterium]